MQQPTVGAPSATYTVVAFHAHPDDEALFTGGSIARWAAEGHRIVLVTATDGERGLAAETAAEVDLGVRRRAELAAAAELLGVARVVRLGYGDSGYGPGAGSQPDAFARVPLAEAAERVAAVLREERADVLTVYDAHGGYGHVDHARVHEVGLAAAERAGTPVVLAATVDRRALLRAVRLLRLVGVRPGGMTPATLAASFTDPAEITHVVDVRRWVGTKQAALAAHGSQAAGGADVRTVRLLSRLPRPLARVVLGREWYVELGRPATRRPAEDVFATLAGR